MPKDLTRDWSKSDKEMANAANLSWKKSAKGGGLGKFSFWVPSEGQGAAAEILPTEDPKLRGQYWRNMVHIDRYK